MDLKNRTSGIPSIIKYFFVGGTAALIDLIIFYLLASKLEINYFAVTIFGFIIATYVNYFLSIKIVFDKGIRYKKNTEIILVYIVSSIGLSVHLLILYLFIDIIVYEKMTSKIIAIGTAFIFNFLLRKYWIFKQK